MFKIACKISAVTLFTLLGLWLGGLLAFYERIPAQEADISIDADAIIVLTGGDKRIEEGAKLLSRNKTIEMLITGVGKEVRLEELLQNVPEVANSVTLGRRAKTTIGNAIEAQEWVESKNINSIILVTANYHMPRALLVFRQFLPKLKITAYPVFPADFKREKWLIDANTRKLVFMEYNKYLLSY